MDLNINDERTLAKADGSLNDEAILQALKLLEFDEFAVLAKADQRYVQTFRESEHEFVLEYRAGSKSEHFVTSTPVGLDSIEAAFLAYSHGDFDTWKSAVEWEQVALG
jgi:hypothetical protein